MGFDNPLVQTERHAFRHYFSFRLASLVVFGDCKFVFVQSNSLAFHELELVAHIVLLEASVSINVPGTCFAEQNARPRNTALHQAGSGVGEAIDELEIWQAAIVSSST